ncbi:hypothetical protein [Sporosarcina sp. YIM B06819]|uniref:hypothetical protein n=1 Tax=Sporosarcina sp. YIM B06819 TaxID=3081769 RepID=UPI00298C92B4|nr:hypothetical protein [Sporosarcina sp. YIM B06819]
MFKNYAFVIAFFVLLFSSFWLAHPASANSPVNGTFVNVTYDEIQSDKNGTEKKLSTVTIKNEQGQTMTLSIDKYATLSVDSVSTTIDAFKYGMEVEVDVNSRRVKAMRGSTGTAPGKIEHRDKVVIGTVNQLDPNGTFLSIRLDNGQSKTYYLNTQTEISKGTTFVDLSVLYEGDRVKLTFSEYNTNSIRSIDIIVQGIKVESLYKGTIQRIEPTANKVILKDEQKFLDWRWQPNTTLGANGYNNSSYQYSAKTPIYVGTKLIQADRLRQYANHDVYFVTVNKAGKEVIEKMVIKQKSERTFYEPMTSINTSSNIIGLQKAGAIRYHDGTILIRNGRLVDPNSLLASGTAFVVTEGNKPNQFANVVHISNDGFQSPNLIDHGIYFGRIQTANSYKLTLNNAMLLSKNNYWERESLPTLSFSNDTVAVEDSRGSVLTIIPQQDEMKKYAGKYGYFYVENNQIVAAHILASTAPTAAIVSVGRIEGITQTNPAIIRIRNVSQWQDGMWKTAGNISSMNIEQATIIKDGKVISVKDLRVNDRLYLLHESKVKGRILLVN